MIVIHANKVEKLAEPKQIPGGYLLAAPSFHSDGEIYFFILGCVLVYFWSLILLLEIFTDFSLRKLLFLSLFLLSGFFLLIFLINGIEVKRWILTTMNLTRGELRLPSYPLRLGESYVVQYRRQLKRGHLSQAGSIHAKWRCYEWAQYDAGSDRETVTHTLWEINLPKSSISTRTSDVEYSAQIHVPSHYPPSFESTNNQLRWELQIGIKLPGIPQDTSCFLLKVIPETM